MAPLTLQNVQIIRNVVLKLSDKISSVATVDDEAVLPLNASRTGFSKERGGVFKLVPDNEIRLI